MRILKYLFLLLLLSFVAASIFVATQKGDFIVERSQVIPTPKNIVYNYVHDLKNWESFATWASTEPATTFIYSKNSIGAGATSSWENESQKGNIIAVSEKENTSIDLKMNYDDTDSNLNITFKDTVGGTKVTWKSVGKMGFSAKIYTFLNGGSDKIIGNIYEKSLANLNKVLNYELKTFAVKSNGIVTKAETFYLKQTYSTKTALLYKNARIVLYKINTFIKQNNIETNGKPFLIFHAYDNARDVSKVSFCVPIKYQIATSIGSDVLVDKLEAFEAVKTTLTGDYIHLGKAYLESKKYISTNNIITGKQFLKLELLNKSRFNVAKPSLFETEIYVPIALKVIKPVIKAATPSTSIESETPTETPKTEKEAELSEF